jgi:hypothetical protein
MATGKREVLARTESQCMDGPQFGSTVLPFIHHEQVLAGCQRLAPTSAHEARYPPEP